MALDEPKDSDNIYEIDGFKYLVDKEFMERAKPLKIDYLINGFKLDCSLDFGAGCTSCGTGSSCGT
ncbi:MAG: hypothetical protein Q8P24_19140 [Desulfobacterales bacterium]|nr:hypothetical protein [Desulfobacterales bacterium]